MILGVGHTEIWPSLRILGVHAYKAFTNVVYFFCHLSKGFWWQKMACVGAPDTNWSQLWKTCISCDD